MNNKALNYQVPESSTIKCSSYFKSTPLSRWSVHGYVEYVQLESYYVKKVQKSSEQFYIELETIRKSEETPSDAKRLLNSILPKVNALN